MSSKTISTGGANYTTSSSYDSYGRPSELTYPSSGSITGPKIRTEYSYGAAYKTTDYSSGSAGTVYHLTTAVNARGQSTGVTYGNGVTASFSYGEDTGWLKGNTVTKAGATIQSYLYDFDDVGNVKTRDILFGIGSSANLKETFLYDDLHRVTSRTVNTKLNLTGALAMTESYGYDGNGNLTNKTNVGYYHYNVTGKPNRLAAVWQNSNFTGTKYYSFTYDNNGNVTNDGKREFIYTAFEKPSKIQQNTDYTDFEYGPNRELIKRIDKRGTNITTTLMLDGYEQITLPTGVVEHKYSVGDAIITKRSNGANETYYLHKDQQGSTTAITDANGTTVQQFLYDPWGKQYLVNNSLLTYTSPATSKGYTGHEMVNDFEVIHMGGRTYNPVLGRFMQADPFIQFPGNLQSYNRYSYVLNNPMSYTDPSGYFIKWAAKKVLGNGKVWATGAGLLSGGLFGGLSANWLYGRAMNSNGVAGVVSVGLNFIPGCQAWCSAVFNMERSYYQTGSLRAALTAGAMSYAASVIGGVNTGYAAGNLLLSAAAGGIMADLSGGKFGHGFVSAGIGVMAGGLFGQNPYAQVIGAAVVGGTISAVTGGKFANGAASAAFAATLRQDWGATDIESQQGPYSDLSDREVTRMANRVKRNFDAALEKGADSISDYCSVASLDCQGITPDSFKNANFVWDDDFYPGQNKHSESFVGGWVDRSNGGVTIRLHAAGIAMQGKTSVTGLAEVLLHEFRHTSSSGTALFNAWKNIPSEHRSTINYMNRPHEYDAFRWSQSVLGIR